MANIDFINIQKKDGLPNNLVNDIIKDDLGFLWIATNDGLCRYDGPNNFKIFKANNPIIENGLASSNIRSLFWIKQKIFG